ncbi:hypothetical protein GCM10010156_29770 [Planobispora rosea]|uniref:histidine kinase n=1 Tax=Planobispora rosea TaxID=35762 RepID=A0A8J3RXY2_PLARO|nr:histidine kinase [Planobispora rosea]GGS68872.1 hypothetical protein GCM10010156_29770 [Planobispora rosea]GIH82062.1 hypothetical protein Pro02_04700 [Planobispora rosea]
MLAQERSPVPLLAVLFLLALALVGVRAATPTDGVFVNDGERLWPDGRLTVQWPTAAGLAPGTEILRVEGRPPADWIVRPHRLPAPAGDITYLVRDPGGGTREVTLPLRRYPLDRQLADNWPAILWVATLALVSAFLLRRRPKALAGRLLAWCSAFQAVAAVAWVFGFTASDLTRPACLASWVLSGAAYQLLWACGIHFALVFPERQPLAVRHRWLIPAVYLALPAIRPIGALAQRSAEAALTSSPVEQITPAVLLMAFLALGYRACAGTHLHDQARLVGLTIAVATAAFTCLAIVPESVTGEPLLAPPLQPLLFLPVPATIVAAVLRHRMLDITVAVNRSAVWLTMTAVVVCGYAAVVAVLSVLFAQWFHPVSSVAASGVVALAFQPIRERVQAVVNRWTYGERDPYRLANRLAQRIDQAQTPAEALSEAVRLIGAQLRLPAVAVELPDGTRITAEPSDGARTGSGRPVRPEPVPLTYQGAQVALLLVEWPPGRAPSSLDRELIDRLAPQLGAAVHVARLTADVRRSRERLVLAREEERRRIYRDLHDGTTATLAATALHLQIAQSALTSEQAGLRDTLGRLVAETLAAAEVVRRVMHDLSPPVLHELGLVRALQEKAITFSGQAGPAISLTADNLPSLPVGVQVAAFRIAVEAMLNVVRHASARHCTVRLTFDGALRLRVRDDGTGLPTPLKPGSGMRSMRERAAELGGSCLIHPAPGGGTELVVVIPVSGHE